MERKKKTKLFSLLCLGTMILSACGTGHIHSYVEHLAADATCTEVGHDKYYTCDADSCKNLFFNEEKKEVTWAELTAKHPALGHSYGSPVVTWDEKGNATGVVKCTRTGCNEQITETKAGTWEVVTSPSCIAKEEGRYKVTFSNSLLGSAQSVLITKDYGNHHVHMVDGKAATCGEAGWEDYFKCELCNRLFEDRLCDVEITNLDEWKVGDGMIPPTGEHDLEKINAVTETCVLPGHLAYWNCVECDGYYSDEEGTEVIDDIKTWLDVGGDGYVPPHGHSYGELQPEVEATCEHAGNVAYYQCSECQMLFDDQKVSRTIEEIFIPKLPHTPEKVEAKAATCEEFGNKEYYYCEECGRFFSDYQCEHEIVDKTSVIIPKLEHKPVVQPGKDAKCEEAGFEAYYKCPNCGKCYEDEEGTTLIPNLEEWKAEGGNGYLAPTGHQEELKAFAKLDETCSAGGHFAYWQCEDCGTYFSDEAGTNKIADLDAWKAEGGDGYIAPHSPTFGDLVAEYDAFREDDGMKAHYNCTKCGAYYTESKVLSSKEELTIPSRLVTFGKDLSGYYHFENSYSMSDTIVLDIKLDELEDDKKINICFGADIALDEYLGYYAINANGLADNYAGVYCNKVNEDGYFRVYFVLSEMDKVNNTAGKTPSLTEIKVLYYREGWSSTGCKVEIEPSKGTILRGQHFVAGSWQDYNLKSKLSLDQYLYVDVKFDTSSADNKVQLRLMEAANEKYTKSIIINNLGELVDQRIGVQVYKIKDKEGYVGGYFRVVINLAQISNFTDGAVPFTYVDRIQVSKWTTVECYLDAYPLETFEIVTWKTIIGGSSDTKFEYRLVDPIVVKEDGELIPGMGFSFNVKGEGTGKVKFALEEVCSGKWYNGGNFILTFTDSKLTDALIQGSANRWGTITDNGDGSYNVYVPNTKLVGDGTEKLTQIDFINGDAGVVKDGVTSFSIDLDSFEAHYCEHTIVEVPAKAATCFEAGNIKHYKCSKCGKLFADEEGTTPLKAADVVIAKLEHNLTKTDAVDPTCTEDGHLAYWYCDKCENYFDAEAALEENIISDLDAWLLDPEGGLVEALGHDLEKIDGKAATCTEDGRLDYWHCKAAGCGKYFSDLECEHEIVDIDTWLVTPQSLGGGVIPATGHQDPLTPHAAEAETCSKAGHLAYWECEDCDSYFSDAAGTNKISNISTWLAEGGDGYIAPHSPVFSDFVAESDAFRENDGMLAHYTCTKCGAYYDENKVLSSKEELTIPSRLVSFGTGLEGYYHFENSYSMTDTIVLDIKLNELEDDKKINICFGVDTALDEYLGYYAINANGLADNYAGVYCNKVNEDGYFRVYFVLSEMDKVNNTAGKTPSLTEIKVLYYREGWSSTGCKVEIEPSKGTVLRGQHFVAGSWQDYNLKSKLSLDQYLYVDVKFDTSSADNKVQLRLVDKDLGVYTKSIIINNKGELAEQKVGVQVYKVKDKEGYVGGYFRLVFNLAQISNYTDGSTAFTCVDRIQISKYSTVECYLDAYPLETFEFETWKTIVGGSSDAKFDYRLVDPVVLKEGGEFIPGIAFSFNVKAEGTGKVKFALEEVFKGPWYNGGNFVLTFENGVLTDAIIQGTANKWPTITNNGDGTFNIFVPATKLSGDGAENLTQIDYINGDAGVVKDGVTSFSIDLASFKVHPCEHTTIVPVAAKAPGCEEPGNIAYYECSSCHRYYEDAEGLIEIVDKTSVLIAAKGHTYGELIAATPAFRGTDGTVEHYTCSDCGHHFDAEHNPLESIVRPSLFRDYDSSVTTTMSLDDFIGLDTVTFDAKVTSGNNLRICVVDKNDGFLANYIKVNNSNINGIENSGAPTSVSYAQLSDGYFRVTMSLSRAIVAGDKLYWSGGTASGKIELYPQGGDFNSMSYTIATGTSKTYLPKLCEVDGTLTFEIEYTGEGNYNIGFGSSFNYDSGSGNYFNYVSLTAAYTSNDYITVTHVEGNIYRYTIDFSKWPSSKITGTPGINGYLDCFITNKWSAATGTITFIYE